VRHGCGTDAAASLFARTSASSATAGSMSSRRVVLAEPRVAHSAFPAVGLRLTLTLLPPQRAVRARRHARAGVVRHRRRVVRLLLERGAPRLRGLSVSFMRLLRPVTNRAGE
jgi:hypothetical protein